MSLAEKMGYLRGLADGMNLDGAQDQQGKLLSALVDVVEELAEQTAANEEAGKELHEQLDELTESLDVLETLVVDSFEDEDDDLGDLDPDEAREVLIARLIAYKQFRGAAAALAARSEAESRMHPRTVGADPQFLGLMPDYLEGITLRSLAVICADIDSKRETFLLESEHIAPKRLPVALTIASVDRLVRSRRRVTFRELVGKDSTPEVVVANFLAILELFKRGLVRVSQSEVFGEIDVEHITGAEAYKIDATALADLDEQTRDIVIEASSAQDLLVDGLEPNELTIGEE